MCSIIHTLDALLVAALLLPCPCLHRLQLGFDRRATVVLLRGSSKHAASRDERGNTSRGWLNRDVM